MATRKVVRQKVVKRRSRTTPVTHSRFVPTREMAADASPPSMMSVPPLADVLAGLRELHRNRQDFHSAEKRLTLQIKGIQRRLHAINCTKDTHAGCDGVYDVSNETVLLLTKMRDDLESQRKIPEKAMKTLAKQLPAYAWAKAVRGFGELTFAQIVAESGDLSKYNNPAKLWTRMGVGLYKRTDDVWERQCKAAGENGVLAQYSPTRRSIMFVIGDCIIKAGGPYRELYDQRKEQEAQKPACGRFKCKGEHCTPGHIHLRAKRYMEKRLLKNLWQEWRKPVEHDRSV